VEYSDSESEEDDDENNEQLHQDKIFSLSFSHRYLASGSADHTVRVWDLEAIIERFDRGPVVKEVEPESKLTRAKTRSRMPAVSEKAAVTTHRPIMREHHDDEEEPLELKREIWRKHKGHVTSVCFSHDGNYLASGSLDGTVCIWNLEPKPEKFDKKDKDKDKDKPPEVRLFLVPKFEVCVFSCGPGEQVFDVSFFPADQLKHPYGLNPKIMKNDITARIKAEINEEETKEKEEKRKKMKKPFEMPKSMFVIKKKHVVMVISPIF